MKRQFTKAQRTAIRGYYESRKLGFKPNAKLQCLEAISRTIRGSRKITGFEACAGTFWFQWKDGVTTTHHERNWWKMKKETRF